MSVHTSDSYLIFSVAGSEFGILTDHVRSVSRALPVVSVPYLPKKFAGLVNFRGDLYLAIDLAFRLGMTRTQAAHEPSMIMLKMKDEMGDAAKSAGLRLRGILVDCVNRIVGSGDLNSSGPVEILDVDALLIEGAE
jgi:chemotaxis signal transduction protein